MVIAGLSGQLELCISRCWTLRFVSLCSYDPMGWEYPSWAHINGPAVNLLKGGILTADRVMTVSKVRFVMVSADA